MSRNCTARSASVSQMPGVAQRTFDIGVRAPNIYFNLQYLTGNYQPISPIVANHRTCSPEPTGEYRMCSVIDLSCIR